LSVNFFLFLLVIFLPPMTIKSTPFFEEDVVKCAYFFLEVEECKNKCKEIMEKILMENLKFYYSFENTIDGPHYKPWAKNCTTCN